MRPYNSLVHSSEEFPGCSTGGESQREPSSLWIEQTRAESLETPKWPEFIGQNTGGERLPRELQRITLESSAGYWLVQEITQVWEGTTWKVQREKNLLRPHRTRNISRYDQPELKKKQLTNHRACVFRILSQ